MIWRLLARAAGPSTLTVVYFHRVLPAADPMLPDEPTAPFFARTLQWLSSQYCVLPLAEALAQLDAGTLPPAAAAITFDDGYRDNLEVAAPLLRAAGLPATFFVATGFLGGGIMWNDRVTEAIRQAREPMLHLAELGLPSLPTGTAAERSHAAGAVVAQLKYLPFEARTAAVHQVERACFAHVPTDLMMTPAQVRTLRAQGFDIGGHTRNHPILLQLDDEAARAEIAGSRDDLRSILGEPVRLFAYPNGRFGQDFDARHRDMVRAAGFEAALSTEPGACSRHSDRFALPRFTPWDRQEWKFRLHLLANQRRRGPMPARRLALGR